MSFFSTQKAPCDVIIAVYVLFDALQSFFLVGNLRHYKNSSSFVAMLQNMTTFVLTRFV